MQDAVVIVIVGACVVWLGWQVYGYIKPRAGKGCAGGCCDGKEEGPAKVVGGAGKTVMISSDDMRARLKARRG